MTYMAVRVDWQCILRSRCVQDQGAYHDHLEEVQAHTEQQRSVRLVLVSLTRLDEEETWPSSLSLPKYARRRDTCPVEEKFGTWGNNMKSDRNRNESGRYTKKYGKTARVYVIPLM